MRVVLGDLDKHLALAGGADYSVAVYCADPGCWNDGRPLAVYTRLGVVSVHELDDDVVKATTITQLVAAGQRHIDQAHGGGSRRR